MNIYRRRLLNVGSGLLPPTSTTYTAKIRVSQGGSFGKIQLDSLDGGTLISTTGASYVSHTFDSGDKFNLVVTPNSNCELIKVVDDIIDTNMTGFGAGGGSRQITVNGDKAYSAYFKTNIPTAERISVRFLLKVGKFSSGSGTISSMLGSCTMTPFTVAIRGVGGSSSLGSLGIAGYTYSGPNEPITCTVRPVTRYAGNNVKFFGWSVNGGDLIDDDQLTKVFDFVEEINTIEAWLYYDPDPDEEDIPPFMTINAFICAEAREQAPAAGDYGKFYPSAGTSRFQYSYSNMKTFNFDTVEENVWYRKEVFSYDDLGVTEQEVIDGILDDSEIKFSYYVIPDNSEDNEFYRLKVNDEDLELPSGSSLPTSKLFSYGPLQDMTIRFYVNNPDSRVIKILAYPVIGADTLGVENADNTYGYVTMDFFDSADSNPSKSVYQFTTVGSQTLPETIKATPYSALESDDPKYRSDVVRLGYSINGVFKSVTANTKTGTYTINPGEYIKDIEYVAHFAKNEQFKTYWQCVKENDAGTSYVNLGKNLLTVKLNGEGSALSSPYSTDYEGSEITLSYKVSASTDYDFVENRLVKTSSAPYTKTATTSFNTSKEFSRTINKDTEYKNLISVFKQATFTVTIIAEASDNATNDWLTSITVTPDENALNWTETQSLTKGSDGKYKAVYTYNRQDTYPVLTFSYSVADYLLEGAYQGGSKRFDYDTLYFNCKCQLSAKEDTVTFKFFKKAKCSVTLIAETPSGAPNGWITKLEARGNSWVGDNWTESQSMTKESDGNYKSVYTFDQNADSFSSISNIDFTVTTNGYLLEGAYDGSKKLFDYTQSTVLWYKKSEKQNETITFKFFKQNTCSVTLIAKTPSGAPDGWITKLEARPNSWVGDNWATSQSMAKDSDGNYKVVYTYNQNADSFKSISRVTISLAITSDYLFDQATLERTGNKLFDSSSYSYDFSPGVKDETVILTFSKSTSLEITFKPDPSAKGSVELSNTSNGTVTGPDSNGVLVYKQAGLKSGQSTSSITAKAIPNTGSIFVKWTSSTDGDLGTNTTLSRAYNKAQTVTAKFDNDVVYSNVVITVKNILDDGTTEGKNVDTGGTIDLTVPSSADTTSNDKSSTIIKWTGTLYQSTNQAFTVRGTPKDGYVFVKIVKPSDRSKNLANNTNTTNAQSHAEVCKTSQTFEVWFRKIDTKEVTVYVKSTDTNKGTVTASTSSSGTVTSGSDYWQWVGNMQLGLSKTYTFTLNASAKGYNRFNTWTIVSPSSSTGITKPTSSYGNLSIKPDVITSNRVEVSASFTEVTTKDITVRFKAEAGGSVEITGKPSDFTNFTSGDWKATSGATSGSSVYVTAKATPSEGMRVLGWYIGSSNKYTNPTYGTYYSSNTDVTVKFERIPEPVYKIITVTVVTSNKSYGKVSITSPTTDVETTDTSATWSGQIEEGSSKSIAVKAETTASNAEFIGWYKNNSLVNSNASFTANYSANATLEARFQQKQSSVKLVEFRMVRTEDPSTPTSSASWFTTDMPPAERNNWSWQSRLGVGGKYSWVKVNIPTGDTITMADLKFNFDGMYIFDGFYLNGNYSSLSTSLNAKASDTNLISMAFSQKDKSWFTVSIIPSLYGDSSTWGFDEVGFSSDALVSVIFQGTEVNMNSNDFFSVRSDDGSPIEITMSASNFSDYVFLGWSTELAPGFDIGADDSVLNKNAQYSDTFSYGVTIRAWYRNK